MNSSTHEADQECAKAFSDILNNQ